MPGCLQILKCLIFYGLEGLQRVPTRVLVSLAQSELKVYDYLMETAACNQTRENVTEFVESCKKFKLAKAEILNMINIRPSSLVEIDSIVEQSGTRFEEEQLQDLVDLAVEVLPSHPNQTNTEEETDGSAEGTAEGKQAGKDQKETVDGGAMDVVNEERADAQ